MKPNQLSQPYSPPRGLNLTQQAEATAAALLPEAGGGVWARQTVGQLTAVKLLNGLEPAIPALATGSRFTTFTADAVVTNSEAWERAKAYLLVADERLKNAPADEVAAAMRSFEQWDKELDRLNGALIDKSARYAPKLPNLKQADDDLKATKAWLESIQAGAETIDTVARVIMMIAPFLLI